MTEFNKGNLGRKKNTKSVNQARPRVNIGARVDSKLWDKFRTVCIKLHMAPGVALDEAMKLFMK